jgi:hypothetical protein
MFDCQKKRFKIFSAPINIISGTGCSAYSYGKNVDQAATLFHKIIESKD